jgi:hypothetical protein
MRCMGKVNYRKRERREVRSYNYRCLGCYSLHCVCLPSSATRKGAATLYPPVAFSILICVGGSHLAAKVCADCVFDDVRWWLLQRANHTVLHSCASRSVNAKDLSYYVHILLPLEQLIHPAHRPSTINTLPYENTRIHAYELATAISLPPESVSASA